MDKKQAAAAADTLLAQERDRRSITAPRRATRLDGREVAWGLAGCGIGVLLGQLEGQALLLGAVGFSCAVAWARLRAGRD